MPKRRAWQFSLLTLFGVVTGVAILFGLRHRYYAEYWLPLMPVAAAALVGASFSSRCKDWRFALRSWGALLAIAGLAMLHLASGYSWGLFGIWTVPGPPGPTAQSVLWGSQATLSVVGLVCAGRGLVSGRPIPQVLSLASALILVAVLWNSVRLLFV